MNRSITCSVVLIAGAASLLGCRKTEVINAPPERAVTPAPVVIEHDRPVYIERQPTVVQPGNTIIERRPDGTVIERRADGTVIERRTDGTVIERPR